MILKEIYNNQVIKSWTQIGLQVVAYGSHIVIEGSPNGQPAYCFSDQTNRLQCPHSLNALTILLTLNAPTGFTALIPKYLAWGPI